MLTLPTDYRIMGLLQPLSLAVASLLPLLIAGKNADMGIRGTGKAWVFTGLGYDGLEEIRTRVYGKGELQSFTVSLWTKNINPAAETADANPGNIFAIVSISLSVRSGKNVIKISH